MPDYPEAVMAHARAWVGRDLYEFNELERSVLRRFFTNVDRSVFFMHTLPQSVGDVLLAMYSRIKNPRGIRGVFVDQFLPQFLAYEWPEKMDEFGDAEKFIKGAGIDSLTAFVNYAPVFRDALFGFLAAFDVDPDYIKKFSAGPRVKKFLSMYLDRYGHNSIARMAGGIWLCLEKISIMAAKSVQWNRPGVGFIELSSRFNDMSGADSYPVKNEIEAYGVPKGLVARAIDFDFSQYRLWQGSEKFDGPFPRFLRDQYGFHFVSAPNAIEPGVIGETCDVLGNFLPACTLTSVGACVSGESLPGLVQHLVLDNLPETIALAEAIIAEAPLLGLDQFLRHIEVTPWKQSAWTYLKTDRFPRAHEQSLRPNIVDEVVLERRAGVESRLALLFADQFGGDTPSFDEVVSFLAALPRGEFDKLPNQFEATAGMFSGTMSFRSWRDLQRQGYSTHMRTLLTPDLGFYRYDKPSPDGFLLACQDVHREGARLYEAMRAEGVPAELMQYALPMGNLVGFHFGGNLAQMEFCGWQRSKVGVNHEVRQVFLAIDALLSNAYPWWMRIARMDRRPAYVFARGSKAIPLSA